MSTKTGLQGKLVELGRIQSLENKNHHICQKGSRATHRAYTAWPQDWEGLLFQTSGG